MATEPLAGAAEQPAGSAPALPAPEPSPAEPPLTSLTRLQSVAVTSVWPTEAHHFTPWLLQMADRGPADHLLGHARVAFVVTGQPPVGRQPGQGPFDHPSLRVDGEPLLAGRLAHKSITTRSVRAAHSTSRPAKP